MVASPPFSQLSLVDYHGILVCFKTTLRDQILPVFRCNLGPSNFLLLKSSRATKRFDCLFSLISDHCGLCTGRSSSLPLGFSFSPAACAPDPRPPQPSPPHSHPRSDSLCTLTSRAILDHCNPTKILIGRQLRVLRFQNRAKTCLRPTPNHTDLDLLTVTGRKLQLSLHATLCRTRRANRTIRQQSLQLATNSHPRPIRVSVIPLPPRPENRTCCLILFTSTLSNDITRIPTTRTSPTTRQRVGRCIRRGLTLHRSLSAAQSRLRSVVRRRRTAGRSLQTTGRRVLSDGRRLRDAGRRLRATGRRVRTAGRRLDAVGSRLCHHGTRAAHVDSSFRGLLDDVRVPVLVLRSSLQVHQFAPATTALFGLVPNSINQPLKSVGRHLTIASLRTEVLTIVAALRRDDRRIRSRSNY